SFYPLKCVEPLRMFVAPHANLQLRRSLPSRMTAPDNELNNRPAAPQGKTRVLVIDDDRKLCRLIRDYLEPMGYEVSPAHSGTEGVERALGAAWDAVILDVMLPGLD